MAKQLALSAFYYGTGEMQLPIRWLEKNKHE